MTIGEKIKELVLDTDSRTDDVAEKLGMSVQNLYKIYKKDSCETKYLETLMNLYGIDSNYFFEGREIATAKGLTMLADEQGDYSLREKYTELLEKYTALLEKTQSE